MDDSFRKQRNFTVEDFDNLLVALLGLLREVVADRDHGLRQLRGRDPILPQPPDLLEGDEEGLAPLFGAGRDGEGVGSALQRCVR